MTHRVLCIGNSHTAGFPLFDPVFGGNPRSSYQYWLKKNCEAFVPDLSLVLTNQGICGQTSREIVTRLRRELDRSRVDYHTVIFWAGANDVALGYGALDIYENIEQGVRISQKFGLNVLVPTIPPMDWVDVEVTILQVNTMLEDNSGECYYLVDVYTVLEENGKLSPNYDCGDGVHLNIQAYKAVASTIQQVLIPILLGRV